MDFIDIMQQVSARAVTKSETGDNRIYGVVVGIVEKLWDSKWDTQNTAAQHGKVCVRIPNRDTDSNILKWAKVAFPYMGAKWGCYYLPEVGDEVLLVFEEGNIDKPYIIGSIDQGSKLVTECANKSNSVKEIKARNGSSMIRYEDDEQDPPQDDKLRLQLFEGKLYMELDSKEESIMISDFKDNKNKNFISLKTKEADGLISVLAQKKVEVKVGENNITATLEVANGKGNVSIKCDNFKVTANEKIELAASGDMKLSSQQNMNVEAMNYAVKASSSAKIEAEGSTLVKGGTINVG